MAQTTAGDLTQGPVLKTMMKFAVPMILGNLLQQCYNVADTLIVGQFIGSDALAAVGSAYTLMTFLTSILLGLCMGSGTVLFHPFRSEGSGRTERSYVDFLCSHCRAGDSAESYHVRRCGSDYSSAAGTFGNT